MDSMTCRGFLLLVSLLLGGCHCIDPMTSQPVVTYTASFPEHPLWSYISIDSLLRLPDNRMLIGATSDREFKLRLLSFSQDGPHVQVLEDLPGDVTSMALLSSGMVAVTRMRKASRKVSILQFTRSGHRVVSNLTLPSHNAGRMSRPVVAAWPHNNAFLVSTFHHDHQSTTIQLMWVNGIVTETVLEDIPFAVNNMALFGDDVYVSGVNVTEDDSPVHIFRLNLRTRTIHNNIGDLDLQELAGHQFYQGAFDRWGTFYVPTWSIPNCRIKDRDEQICCRCIMVITTEGQKRVIQPSDVGLPVYDSRHIYAVTTTPFGFATATVVEKKKDWRKTRQGVIQVYELV
ncbi:uncharacterized protein LOC143276482 [Babylonia areolata]|uniref:uncharacterized protein LOC143276482 n=1 Tax=Babylonia areolata TaxID=304850 RepID=UPI003FD3E7AA